MWMFVRSGFFSAVRHNAKPDTIHVRARFAGDLERLCQAHGVKPRVQSTPTGDYRWRMDFPRAEWARIAAEEAAAIDYDNFKDAVHDGTVRDDAYMEVWSDLRGVQDALDYKNS